MDIVVLGAGSMGSLYGGLLAAANPLWSVTLVDIWADHVETINKHGLRIDGPEGEKLIKVRANKSAEGLAPADLVLVFTKTLHTEVAMRAAGNLLGPETWLMSLQNGLGNIEKLSQFVPVERLIIGVTNFACDLKGPGHIHQTGVGETKIRLDNGGESSFVSGLALSLTGAGLNGHYSPEVMSIIWEKAAFNAAFNSLCAISGCPVGAVAANVSARELAMAAAEEALAAGQANGVTMNRDRLMKSMEMAMAHHTHHKPSMLQDMLAGRQTEIESINGAIYKLAQARGVEAPVNGVLYRLVRFLEDSRDWRVD